MFFRQLLLHISQAEFIILITETCSDSYICNLIQQYPLLATS